MEQREKLIELLDIAFLDSDDNYGMPNIEQVADHLIANGVVVLPCRCENCKNSAGESLADGQTFCMLHIYGFNDDDFCSYGERKDDIVDLCTTGHLHLGYDEDK